MKSPIYPPDQRESHECFQQLDNYVYKLKTYKGTGEVEVHNIEEGLIANSWQICTLENETILEKHHRRGWKHHLTFILEGRDLQLLGQDFQIRKHDSWNIALTKSPKILLRVSNSIRYQFLVVHLSESWIERNVGENKNRLLSQPNSGFYNGLVLLDRMNCRQLTEVLEIFESTISPFLKKLTVKSMILKLISDYLLP